MKHQAKAPSAGSTQGTGNSAGRRARGVIAIVALAICAFALTAAPALSDPLTSATMGPITNVSYGSAHVSGTIHTNGATYWRFDYSTDGVHWVEGPGNAHGGPIGGGDTPIEADLTGLKGGTRYYVRIGTYNAATGEAPLSPEPNPEFTTLAADPPSVESIDNPTGVEYTTAEVSGTVNRPANSNDLTCNFEYVSDAQFTENQGQSLPGFEGAGQAPCGPIATVGSSTVSTELTGLSSGTTYHLRLAVANASAADSKEAANFTTQTATAPALVLDPPTEVKYTTAHISGSVDPEGGNIQAGEPLPIRWELQSTPDPVEFGWFFAGEGTIEGAAAEGTSPVPVSANLESLQNGRQYKFRLVVSTAGSVAISPEGTFQTEAVSAPVVAADEATAVTGTSAHFSGHVTAGNVDPAFDATCSFDYVNDQQFQIDGFASAQQIACGPNPVSGASSTEVTANSTGLEANTVYHLRLRAENQGGQNTDVANTFETDPIAPTAQTLFANQVTTHSALLTARVNPHNSAVIYRFEWGTDATYGGFAPALPTPLGFSGNSPHVITVAIAGLQESSTYHFRISATNTETNVTTNGVDHVFTTPSGAGSSGCPNEQRRAESNSLALPECRGYELVMPAVKDFPFGQNGARVAVASLNGDAVAYQTYGPMPGAVAGQLENYNVSRRGGGEWVNTPISPPQTHVPNEGQFPYTSGFSENLTYMAIRAGDPPLAPGAPSGVGSLYVGNTEALTYTYLGAQSTGQFAVAAWISAEGSHVVYEAPSGHGGPAYEFVDGAVRAVNVLPGGATAESTNIGQGAESYQRVTHAVSEDGRRIVWNTAQQRLYDSFEGGNTIELSASKRSIPDPTGLHQTLFWGASTNGGKVFFTTATALTENATPGGSRDLYEYDLEANTLTDLTWAAGGAAGVQGVIGNSDDGKYVYFVAGGDLGGGAEAGVPNLYLAHGGAITYIGALNPADNAAWEPTQSSLSGQAGITARVSANGQLAIQSVAPLTGYDNVNPSTTLPTSQVYLYLPGPGTLICASCRPDGSPPSGDSTITPPTLETNTPRNLSDDGSRLFFSSTDAIIPADTNGKSDVYEWTAGAPHLISDGTSDFNSFFLDASLNGEDVIFSTGARLVGQDTDSHVDLYDARIGGGFAKPPAAPVPCEGEACRGAGSAAPDSLAPTTPSFVGPGNPKPDPKATKRAKALKACRAKHHSKKQRKKCESQVKKRFANKKSGRGK